jgi:predicted transcriptional regulator
MIQFIRKLFDGSDKKKPNSLVSSDNYSVSFRTDDTYIKALEDLAEKTNRSRAEVIRDAMNLYIRAVDEWGQGRGITFVSMEEARPSMERLEFEASQSFVKELDAFAKESEVGRAEIIRRSLNLYAWASEEAKKGNQLQPVPFKIPPSEENEWPHW